MYYDIYKYEPKKNIIAYYIYNMELSEDIKVIEDDLQETYTKCQRVNCSAIYDAIMSSFKLLYDLFFMCCKKKD